jgi:protein-L-isoaspartate(D-aspartate) O-methyltransferase
MESTRAKHMQEMLRRVERHFADTAPATGIATLPAGIRAAMAGIPRHKFVPEPESARAYQDSPLPIGGGQTISQPFVVALMTALLDPQPGDCVLEIGTGSGYQAAVLSRLVEHVYTIEIVDSLAKMADAAIRAMRLDNVTVVCGNGADGLAEYAPYDKIIITAASPEVPPALKAQLRTGGHMVMPLGEYGYGQELVVLVKQPGGELQRFDKLRVNFVPFTGR